MKNTKKIVSVVMREVRVYGKDYLIPALGHSLEQYAKDRAFKRR